ncbi:hypothetical protein [Gloeothece verrucosa]|uniref:Uncharacterized protein n=1 Tax=Gloeothece verrucosa (strain PCC 7822) TaxID=497965 RepID=E0UEK0_GLOV7|nr:hypothetical protein [Gloeothece verrucosa]ADN16568.1 hypothetical protein Cyan7822_4662 [Gloeothece verrucosa PCC 7822]
MMRPIGVVLGIGALILISTNEAVAAPLPNNANQGVQKRADRALSNIENRSVSKDFEAFFLDQTTINYPQGTVGERSQGQNQPQLLDNIRIEIGDDSPNNKMELFPNARGADRSNSSQILYQFEEW